MKKPNKKCKDTNKIYLIRKERGLTQSQLAEKSKVNIRQIQRIENGESSIGNITLSNAICLADALGIDDIRDLL